ncbi:hypothetical protein BOW53_13335 [Solemya pervernicosa gill symbiont]|uniref:Uncharacterized protein n=1 Tax=Solemya pervernicosa gill symbiont TaxID=642797 RepID=A0A1T2L1N0_9GAMM|nr:hypothetical protein [Solemya pervernicosa gill symbiont]OOZ39023.1 hypothetical protein BOW53_13335 [Solemya pervernicosa gill symbiont]
MKLKVILLIFIASLVGLQIDDDLSQQSLEYLRHVEMRVSGESVAFNYLAGIETAETANPLISGERFVTQVRAASRDRNAYYKKSRSSLPTVENELPLPENSDELYCNTGKEGCVDGVMAASSRWSDEIDRGVAIFAEACFGRPSPSKRQILNATVYAYGAPTVLRGVDYRGLTAFASLSMAVSESILYCLIDMSGF